MAALPHEITFTTERRQVAITKGDMTERLGFFHKWSETGDDDLALVENTEGTLEYIPVHAIRFLPIGDDILPKELEKIYKEMGLLKKESGLLKDGASCFVRKTETEDTENRCAICLEIIPEGRHVCPNCEKKGWKKI